MLGLDSFKLSLPDILVFIMPKIILENAGIEVTTASTVVGEIYGKIIEKNQTIITDEVNWESIDGKKISNYDYYTKKLFFNKTDTLNCKNGCYLLIKLKFKDIGENLKEKANFPLTIIVTLTNKDILNLTPIKFNFDDYVVGYLFNNNSELYEIIVPDNSTDNTI